MKDLESITGRIEEVRGLAPGAVNEDAVASFFRDVMVELDNLGAGLPNVTGGDTRPLRATWSNELRELVWEYGAGDDHVVMVRIPGDEGSVRVRPIEKDAHPRYVARKLISRLHHEWLPKAAARSYLTGKGVTLWGDWDISRPEGLDAAAEWLSGEILGVRQHVIDLFDGY